jgi:hypothetical protein
MVSYKGRDNKNWEIEKRFDKKLKNFFVESEHVIN